MQKQRPGLEKSSASPNTAVRLSAETKSPGICYRRLKKSEDADSDSFCFTDIGKVSNASSIAIQN